MHRFKPVVDFIEASLENEIRLSELAALAGLSVPRFAHAFKAAYGIAPYRYLIERRIARAKQLLSSGDRTIATTAAHLGFSSQSHFGVYFARLVGTTPSAYRSNVRRRHSKACSPPASPTLS